MVRKRGVRVTIIAEDESLERFAREVLLSAGFNRREIRVLPYPVGTGSAKDWVTKQYPTEVQAIRSKNYQSLAVVVATDADQLSLTQRGLQLAAALHQASMAAREPEERIVHWIPKWNIETWLLYFAGDKRDEDHDYKHDVSSPEFRTSSQAFLDEYRKHAQGESLSTLVSLRLSYEETRRLGI